MKTNITFTDIDFTFDGITPFFKNLHLQIECGKLHLITGKNGIGKSTFFNIVQCNLDPRNIISGTILYDNTTVNLSDAKQHHTFSKQVQAVPQVCADMLADKFSFNDNLRFAQLRVLPGLQALPKPTISFETFFADFNIDPEKPARYLSGGQKQICAILMALSQPTKILLLDEPTAALDQANTQLLMRFIHHIVDTFGITVLMICHDQDIIDQQNEHIEIVSDAQGYRTTRKVLLENKRESSSQEDAK